MESVKKGLNKLAKHLNLTKLVNCLRLVRACCQSFRSVSKNIQNIVNIMLPTVFKTIFHIFFQFKLFSTLNLSPLLTHDFVPPSINENVKLTWKLVKTATCKAPNHYKS